MQIQIEKSKGTDYFLVLKISRPLLGLPGFSQNNDAGSSMQMGIYQV